MDEAKGPTPENQTILNASHARGRVGVVAIGRNEGERLIQCIDSLAPLGLPIVYVESASTDGSPAMARTRGADVLDQRPEVAVVCGRRRERFPDAPFYNRMCAVRSGFGYAQVWWTTRQTGKTLYAREVARSLFWALLLSLLVVTAGLLNPLYWLLLPAIYSLQIARMAIRSNVKNSFFWKLAIPNILGKFGETLSIFRFIVRSLKGQRGGAIFYK